MGRMTGRPSLKDIILSRLSKSMSVVVFASFSTIIFGIGWDEEDEGMLTSSDYGIQKPLLS